MWIFYLGILLSTGLAFETVCSSNLHVKDKDANSRKRRQVDEEDVINRFEMERVSPLYDIVYPPFEREWNLPGPPLDRPPKEEFKLEVRDEEHVVSHSGKRFRENSAAVKWWYSVESFTHFNGSSREFEQFPNSLQRQTPKPYHIPRIGTSEDAEPFARIDHDRKMGISEDIRPEETDSAASEKYVEVGTSLISDRGDDSSQNANFTLMAIDKDRSDDVAEVYMEDNTMPNISSFRSQNSENGVGQDLNVTTGPNSNLQSSNLSNSQDLNLQSSNVRNRHNFNSLSSNIGNSQSSNSPSSNTRTGPSSDLQPSNAMNGQDSNSQSSNVRNGLNFNSLSSNIGSSQESNSPPSNIRTGPSSDFQPMSRNFTLFEMANNNNFFTDNQVTKKPSIETRYNDKPTSRPSVNRHALFRHSIANLVKNFTNFDQAKKARKQDEDHVISHVPSLRTGRGFEPFDVAVLESPTTPQGTVTPAPLTKEFETKPNITTRYILLQSGRVVAINVTVGPSVYNKPKSGAGNNPVPYFGGRLRKNSTKIENFTISANILDKNGPPKPLSKPTKSPQRVLPTTKLPNIPVSNSRLAIPTWNSVLAVRNLPLSTIKPLQKQTPPKSAPLLAEPKSTTPFFILPPVPTKPRNLQTSTRQPATTRKPSNSRTITTTKPPDAYTRNSTPEPTRNSPPTKSTPNPRLNLPPRNVVETIFNVFQPGTSETPFLIVTYDSLKMQFPPSSFDRQTERRNGQTERRPGGNRLVASMVEYEDSRPRPKPMHLNGIHASRTSVAVSPGIAARPTASTITNANRGPALISASPLVNSSPKQFDSRMKHEFVRISNVLIPQEDTTTRKPQQHRGSHFLQPSYNSHLPATPTVLQSAKPTETPQNRRSRQHQGFHLRNTVGFQTSSPGAFSDRRSIAGSSTAPPVDTTAHSSVDKMAEVFGMRFEPTRRGVRLDAPQLVTSVTPEPSNPPRNRNPTKKPSRSSVNKPSSNKPWLIQEDKPRARETTKTTTTTKPKVDNNRTGRNSRTRGSPQVLEEKQDGEASSTTSKPFRVYFFEPKRKRTKQVEDTTTTAATQTVRTSQSPHNFLRPVQIINTRQNHRPSSNLQVAPRTTTHPQTIPTPAVDNSRRARARFNHAHYSTDIPTTPTPKPRPNSRPPPSHQAAPRTTTPKPTIPAQPANTNRRGRARESSDLSSTDTPTTSTAKPKKKPRHSPFIWHRPNVGLTKPPTTTTSVSPVVTTTSARVSSRAILRRSSVVEIPPRDSFQDIFFNPVEIERLVPANAA
ncbi:hypothetical protein JTE90_001670 [Oedothorax gibbosus]|uniref:Uncharacterized protein n=1 Tax=Oedothorax gibbosus TaxID=931172 RepID=A0AAV6UJ23_9ARAC|nr:hypothetical protein JTE90_001670 [Oedothorax gibbosus]